MNSRTDSEKKRLLQAALRVMVESMASDNLARARRSKREDELRHAIEDQILGSERRSRENGWSYLAKLTEHLGRWPNTSADGPLGRGSGDVTAAAA